MFRLCFTDVLRTLNNQNVASQRFTLSSLKYYQISFCHTAPAETVVHHGAQGTGRNLHPVQARAIINQTFVSVSHKLKLPSLKPVYTTVPIHGKGNSMWKTVLTLRWPEKLSFEAIGRNKKEAEELVAQQALTVLHDSKIISPSGKLLCELSTHRTLQSTDKLTIINDDATADASGSCIKQEEMAAIEAKFPNFKSTLLNCFMKVSNHMKNANFIARPAFKRVKNGSISDWQASYSLKWPEPKEFSGIGTNRAEAEKLAILSALHWLTENNFLHQNGYPILYSNEELSKMKSAVTSPAIVKLPPALVNELDEILNDFKKIKPLMDEDQMFFERETAAANSLISEDEKMMEEIDEERDVEESIDNIPTSSSNEYGYNKDDESSVDPITGRKVLPLSSAEIEKRSNELFLSAQTRIIEKGGPVIPFLPIAEKREAILDLIEQNRVVVLSGGTGCGKSTQMPQYLLDSYALKHRGTECNIIVTQPRRLAALSLAQTVANYRGEKIGESVGYQVRLNSVLPRHPLGRILFCSTGILLRRLQACPDMSGVSHLIIDEVHERDCLTDFTLVILKDLLQSNPLLKVILMSASLNADLLSRYFDSAPLIHVEGRTFPVQRIFLPEVQSLTRVFGERNNTTNIKPMVDQALVVKLVRYIDINKPSQGSILIFLPGWAEIKSLHSKLKEFYPSDETHWILPVHSRLSQVEQERIFDRPPEGVRKIVLATNIAETSLTINDCVYVIDPGVHKELRYNSQRGSAVMENQWIAKANAQQRAGRAGRVQPGEAFHLYSEEKHEEMERFPQAEILRIPLEKVVMDIKAYNENLKSIDFLSRTLEPPSHRAIRVAIRELESIGALDEHERLTPLGRRIAQFSTHPRLAKSLVFATLFRCLDPVASIVAGLSSAREGWSVESTVDNQRQIIRQAKYRFHPTSDHLALASLMRQFRNQRGRYEVDEFCENFQANVKSLYFLKGVRSLLVDHLKDANLLGDRSHADSIRHPVNQHADNEEMIKAALVMGFGDRILRVRRGKIVKGIIKSNELVILSEKHGPVHIVPDSVNADGKIKSDFMIYFNGIFSTERKAFVVRDTTQISNMTAVLTAGRSFTAGSQLDEVSDSSSASITIDESENLQFACSPRETRLLMELRESLSDTCDFLLRTAGLRQTNELTSVVGKFHGRQVDMLARLLSTKNN
ncbi:hypothetical protein OUZ56_001938 [Daphnia magna]|uniref:RNA helicase n=1 Tax=Daphnia magna TaxID=35525 RepID=A0ABR0A474_9CRUS|nr:hypothetical protein OUZ56_001938 [Daphnia magna]